MTPALPIARLLPGETVWSAAARTHALLAGRSAKATLHVLFGDGAKYAPCQLLPSRLREFSRQSARLGVTEHEVDRLVEMHTGLRYFTHHQTRRLHERAKRELLKAKGPARVRALLGLQRTAAVGVGFRPYPAFCKRCVREDRARLGFAYWRVVHQLPVVLICPFDNEPLHELIGLGGRSGMSRFELHLPPTETAEGSQTRPVARELLAAIASSAELAARAATLLEGTPLPAGEWQRQTKGALLELGFRTHGGVNYKELAWVMRKTFGSRTLEWLGLKEKNREMKTEPLRRLLTMARGCQPTARYLLLDVFVRTYRSGRSHHMAEMTASAPSSQSAGQKG